MSDAIIPFEFGKLTVAKDVEDKYLQLGNIMAGKREGFEDEGYDWTPAILKIVQPVTQDAAKPSTAKNGDIFHKGGLVKTPMRFVLAYAWTSRVRFVNGVDKIPSCSSENVDTNPSHRGSLDQSMSVYGEPCNKCPFDDQPFAQGKPTNCNNVLNVILVPESLENVFQFQFSKSSFTAGRQFTDLARATPTAWSRFYELTTEAKKRPQGGLYYLPSITPIADSPVPEHLKAFAQYVNKRVSAWRAPKRQEIRQRPQGADVATHSSVDESGRKNYTDTF